MGSLRYILKVGPTRFADGLDMRDKRKKRSKDDSIVLDLSN